MKLAFVSILCSLALAAQDPRGTIAGQVLDRSGAVVPGAAVRAANAETNVVTRASANEQGHYEIPYLPAGFYTLAAEHAGFKTWTKAGVQLRMGDRVLVDINLELGNVNEVVEVTAQAPALETATGSMGQVMGSRQVGSLPLRSGSVSWVFSMAPGVILQSLPYDGPWNIDQASQISLAGGGNNSANFNIDGVSNNSYGSKIAFVPPPDMVDEVRINTANYDASEGHTRGGSINISLKSGTNALHGSVGASVSSGPMMTRTFFQDQFIFDPATGPVTPQKIRDNTPSVRWLRESAVAGGPVYLPKLYDGRNRTFWMFGYQMHNRRRPISSQYTVPTAAERAGDFSALLAIGPQYQIYDPRTTVPAPNGRFSRQPLPRNIISPDRVDPVSRKILQYYPAPNKAGSIDGLNNYTRARQETQILYQPVARLDENFSDRHRMFARYEQTDFTGHFDELIPNSQVRGRDRKRPHYGAALDNVFVLSPSTVLDVRYGFTWFAEIQSFDNLGWDLSPFGFPPTLLGTMDPHLRSFPEIAVGGLVTLGNNSGYAQKDYSHSLLTSVTHTAGQHSIKTGVDVRQMLENYRNYGYVSPHLDFADNYTHGPLDNSPAAPFGQGVAGFLLGIPTGGYLDINDSYAERNKFLGLFVQDDWRLSRKLTLNLGLRWEAETPTIERYNRGTADFNFQALNPIQPQAQAQYAKNPISQIAPADFRTRGGPTFLGRNGAPGGLPGFYGGWMPRFGLAYQLRPKLVLRGGYGIFFGLRGLGYVDVNQPGFNQRTNVISTLDNGQTYIGSISNPLPLGVQQPAGAAGGLTTYLGRSPGFQSSDGRRPYTQRWSASVQFQPQRHATVEIGYLGSRSVHQRVTTEFNSTPRQYLSASPVRDQPVIDLLSAKVPNPFVGIAGFAGAPLYSAVNTTVGQLVLPYPEFTGLSAGLPAGFSWYHALTARFERRFARGLQMQASYTWSRTLEALGYLNPTDSRLEHVASDLDRPQRFAGSLVYEIPLRPRRALLKQVAGGWALDAIYQAQSGPPLGFGNVIYAGAYAALALSNGPSPNLWFNTAGFVRASNQQLADNLRTFPSAITAVRAAGISVADLSVHKLFPIRERLKLELRGDGEGILNHPNFAAPNLNPASTLFGTVNGTQTNQEERRIFVGLKLMF